MKLPAGPSGALDDDAASLEASLLEDVALDDTVDAKLHNEVVARLETVEKKLRCLMGTERGKAIAQLETELEERDETIAALREALDLAARPRSPRTPPPLKPAPVDQTELALDLASSKSASRNDPSEPLSDRSPSEPTPPPPPPSPSSSSSSSPRRPPPARVR